jgi:hypothetical protein
MRHLRHVSAAGGAVFVALLAAFGPLPAAAQSTGPALTTEEIRACLCQKQAIDRQQDMVDTQGVLLEERQQELTSLDAEIKRQAATLPAEDVVGQQVLQDLIHQQMALRNLIQLEIRPAQIRSISALRDAVNAYNAQCTARPRYALDSQEAEKNLVCPEP